MAVVSELQNDSPVPSRCRQIGLEAVTEVGAVAVTGSTGAQLLADDAVTFTLATGDGESSPAGGDRVPEVLLKRGVVEPHPEGARRSWGRHRA